MVTSDTSWLVIQGGSAALKPSWRNKSALELEAICVVWTLENLAYYLKGCPAFDLWTDHSHPSPSDAQRVEEPDTQNAEVQRSY